MSVAMSQLEYRPTQGFFGLVNSEQLMAVGSTLLLHLIVVLLLLISWQANTPPPPNVSTMKVQMVVQPIADMTPQETPQDIPVVAEAPPENIKKETPQKVEPKRALTESDFAKKRVEEPPEPVVEHHDQQEMEAPAEAPVRDEHFTDVSVEKTPETTSSQTNPTQMTEMSAKFDRQEFDISQYSPVRKDAPIYPKRALDKGVQGACTVQYTVNTQGLVENPVALNDCHPFFIKPSLEATRSFRYTPRLVGGEAVKVPNVKNTFLYRIE